MESASNVLLVLSLTVLGLTTVVMLGAWAFGLSTRNGGWTDVFRSFGSGIILAGAALWPQASAAPQARQWLLAALARTWAVRLGG